MRAHALVSQSMVVGDGKPFIAALITIDPEAFVGWAEANGKSGKTVGDLVDDPELRAEIQKAVDEANQARLEGRVDPDLPHPAGGLRGRHRAQPEDVGQAPRRRSEKYGHVIEDIYSGAKR